MSAGYRWELDLEQAGAGGNMLKMDYRSLPPLLKAADTKCACLIGKQLLNGYKCQRQFMPRQINKYQQVVNSIH